MSRKPTDATKLAARAYRRLTTWLKPRTVFLGDAGGNVDLVVESFRAWCANHSGAACELALSSRWVVSCVPPVGAGRMTERELRQYAQRQIAHYLEDAREPGIQRWAMAVSGRPDVALVCAASGQLIDRLKSAAVANHVDIRQIFPWWLTAISPSAEPTRTVVAAEPTILTIAHFEQGRLHRISTDFDAGHPERGAIVLWPRPDPMPVACDAGAVVNIITATRRKLSMDLLEAPPRAWLGSWALLLVAVICALAEAHRQDNLSLAQEREQAMLDRVMASRSRTRQAVQAPLRPVNGQATPDTTALEAAATMLSLQQHPWADVFAGVEAASGQVAMLSLEHDAQRLTVDIELAVPNDDAAWGFAERMAADTGRFRSATLLSRQPLASPVGALTGRARVQAVLAGAPVALRGRAP